MASRGRGAVWDKERGRRMYDEGATPYAIAAATGVSRGVISGHAARYWPVREIDAERRDKFFHARLEKPTVPKAKRLAKGALTLPALGSLKD